ncbi:VIT1/CCC1 transporter family protein [Maricaulis sp.]|uniref:VIT1/CCC1 transporter family protein n=1 Tax=Maricaulis sp. TaxID=1486257 RepID=UPI003A909AEF
MKRSKFTHPEHHGVERIGWLRAGVLGANDGIVSTASLIVGVAAANAGPAEILVAGTAGLVAGAMSMAAGEYVSVSSQADAEAANLARERQELADDPVGEQAELAGIYVARGLTKELADQVAVQLMAKNALQAHARDELAISAITTAKPIQAAVTSAITFSTGAALPLLVAVLAPHSLTIPATAIASLISLAALGGMSARIGGADIVKATVRVTFWGAVAMAVTAAIGAVFGVAA